MSDAENSPPNLEKILGQYGETEREPLSRIQIFGGKSLSNSWRDIPHVTHNDEIDVTDLESHRRRQNDGKPREERLTPLPFLMKAVARTLGRLPRFKAALDEDGKHLITRQYCHLGFAIDTEAGLVVAVLRDVDKKDLHEIGQEIRHLSEKARSKGLTLAEMSGGCFTVSSLGDLGGTGFTPIINTHQVGILGVSRLYPAARPAPDGGIAWRQHLPVCLSYDHRVINGADAGRFMQQLKAEMDSFVG